MARVMAEGREGIPGNIMLYFYFIFFWLGGCTAWPVGS